jgi:hypothetical protein
MKNISFVVVIECRPRGAIGLFSKVSYFVSRPNADVACAAVFQEAQDSGYETRFIVSCDVV